MRVCSQKVLPTQAMVEERGLADVGACYLYMRKHELEDYKDYVQLHLEPEFEDDLPPIPTRLEGLLTLIVRTIEGETSVSGKEDLSLSAKEARAWRGAKPLQTAA